MTAHHDRPSRARRLLPGLVLAAACLSAACGGAAAAPTRQPTPSAPPTLESAGPTSWKEWIDHQGFGAQLGPNEVRRMARAIAEHGGSVALFDLDQDIQLVTDLIAWLDAHPATACWADYHDEVRTQLVIVLDAWTAARPEVEAGRLVPAAVVAAASEGANAANDLPAPADCP
jgi:hypothetical protein